MPGVGDRANAEDRINELKSSIDKYLTGVEEPTGEALAEVTKAVHELADQVVDLHRRFDRVEETLPQWTTHGWLPPPGGNVAEDG